MADSVGQPMMSVGGLQGPRLGINSPVSAQALGSPPRVPSTSPLSCGGSVGGRSVATDRSACMPSSSVCDSNNKQIADPYHDPYPDSDVYGLEKKMTQFVISSLSMAQEVGR